MVPKRMPSMEYRIQELIARDLGVNADVVDATFICERRREMYAHASRDQWQLESKYGGYHPKRLRFLTPTQIDLNRKTAQAFLARYVKP